MGERLGGMAVNGPLGRTVADTAALLEAMSGYATGDPYWLPKTETSFVECASRPVRTLKIGYAINIPPVGKADDQCAQAVIETTQRLADLGHHIEAFDLPDLAAIIEPFRVVWQSVLVESGVPWFVMEKMNRWLYWRAYWVNCGKYLQAVSQLHSTARTIVEACQPYDVVLLPVYMQPAIRVGEWSALHPQTLLQRLIEWVAPCPPFNATGQPAMAVPTGFDANGVPVGVQLVGRPADEGTLLSLAAQMAAAAPWNFRPPMSR